MKVGVLGTGSVGQTLAAGFAKKGHDVMIGTRDPEATRTRPAPNDWTPAVSTLLDQEPAIALGTFEEAAVHGDIVVLAVEGAHALDVVAAATPDALAGKLVLDTTNPLNPTDHGVHRADIADGLIEQLQAAAPEARFVKAWNCTPGVVMVDPDLPGGPGTQFICGDDEAAKKQAAEILQDFGWDAIDIGDVRMGHYIEDMAIVVINHGMRSGGWHWGLKLLGA